MARPGAPAIVHAGEDRAPAEVSWDELTDQVARCAAGLRRLGVERGDRVVAYLPNAPETVVALLATASIGAVWSSCAPEFGVPTVVDRFAQIEPKVLLATDGYSYGGKRFDRADRVREIAAAIPSLEHTVMVPSGWDELLAEPAELSFEQVPFDHPLWVLYSSGTTGLPKAIVQGQGGILIEHLKKARLHSALTPGRPLLLVHHDGLDDVELPGWRPARGQHDRALRRPAGRPRALAPRGRGGSHRLRHQRGLHHRLHEGGRRARPRGRPVAPQEPRLHRLPAPGRGLRVGVRAREAGPLALLHERRHRPLHGLRGRLPRAARLLGRDPGALPRRRGGGLGRGGPAAHRRGGRARDHPSRCRRCRSTSGTTPAASATARATSTPIPASGATATGSSSTSAAAR